jgi:hexosaminidase
MMVRSSFIKAFTGLVIGAGFAFSNTLAAPLPQIPAPAAFQGSPAANLIPRPREMNLSDGTLGLDGLSIKLEGKAEELTWAARDLGLEARSRLGRTLEVGATAKSVRIGTLENAALASDAKTRNLLPDKPEGYALWVDANGAAVVGFDAKGAYRGAQTLRQLLTAQGFKFAAIRDWPMIPVRVAMIYMDANSKPVNDVLIPILAKLKFSHLLVMANYVQWDSTKNIWHPQGASKAEARRIAELIRTNGMEAIPLIETPGHAQWFFYNNQNRDLVQDPLARDPYAYDTLNPRTYDVILPILTEAVEVFKPKFVHVGHDEVAAQDRGAFPGRDNGKAVGLEKLVADHLTRLHDHLKSMNVSTMIWHDMVLSDAHRDKILPNIPKDIVIMNWHYAAASDYPTFKLARDAGFQSMGASWFAPQNPEVMAKTVVRENAFGAVQTRWTGYFGNTSIFDGATEQGLAYVNAGASFWNPDAPIQNGESARFFRDGNRPASYAGIPGTMLDLRSLVTRQLTDPDETQWIQKGSGTDLSSLPTGAQRVGAYLFQIGGAIMLKGARPAASDLPASATLEIGAKAPAIAFLHTTGWTSPITSPRTKIGAYTIQYADGPSLVLPLEYGRNITGWTDVTPKTIIYDQAWRGKTKDDLDVGVTAWVWTNPNPTKIIQTITVSSEGLQSNPTLIGLTLLEKTP